MHQSNAETNKSYLKSIASLRGVASFESTKTLLSDKYKICEILITVIRKVLLWGTEKFNRKIARQVNIDFITIIEVFEHESNSKELEPFVNNIKSAQIKLLAFIKALNKESSTEDAAREIDYAQRGYQCLFDCRDDLKKALEFLKDKTVEIDESRNVIFFIQKLDLQKLIDSQQDVSTTEEDNLSNISKNRTSGYVSLAPPISKENSHLSEKDNFDPSSIDPEKIRPYIKGKYPTVPKFNTLCIDLKGKGILEAGYDEAKDDDDIENRLSKLMADLQDSETYGEFVEWFLDKYPGIKKKLIKKR